MLFTVLYPLYTLQMALHFIRKDSSNSKLFLEIGNIFIYFWGLATHLSLALTHLLEDISTAAHLAQQLAVGDGHVVVRWVSLPEKIKIQEEKHKQNLSLFT